MKTLTPLVNPLLSDPERAIKDACIVSCDNGYKLYCSSFYWSGETLRCEVVERFSPDLREFSQPTSVWSGIREGFRGMCSPNVSIIEGKVVLTMNSWGDMPQQKNQLFYCCSKGDSWTPLMPLAQSLTQGSRAIDAALVGASGGILLAYKKEQRVTAATALSVEGPWLEERQVECGGESLENYQLLHVEDQLYAVATNFGRGHVCQIYKVVSPFKWQLQETLQVEPQTWSRRVAANSGFLFHYRGKWALLYAGSSEAESFEGRGHSSLGLALSNDLRTFTPLGEKK